MVAAIDPAPQHRAPITGAAAVRAPRPLPLFLDMVRDVATRDPAEAAAAMAGLRAYGAAHRPAPPARVIAASSGHARLLQCGTSGPPVVLVPSLINPSAVLDLDADRSLLGHIGASGYRALLLDWGTPDASEAGLDIAGHVETLLLPLLAGIGEPVHLVGYCLGGTMAIAAAMHAATRSLTLLATPWHFERYPSAAADRLGELWRDQATAVDGMGVMPIEYLQPAFWSLDAERTVAKYAALAGMEPADPRLTTFAALEDWANDGAPLTAAAARDLFEGFIGDDVCGRRRWRVGGRVIDPASLPCPALHLVATGDRIAPAETAPDAIRHIACPSGHVGMVVGSRARSHCWTPMLEWFAQH